MTRIVVDAALLHRLGNLCELAELCDETGRVLAHVVPAPNVDEYELIEPPISQGELDRREASEKWYTTDQVATAAHFRRRPNRSLSPIQCGALQYDHVM